MSQALRFLHVHNTFLLAALLILHVYLLNCVHAKLYNVTIDDQDGDPTNGNKIIYTPSTSWQAGQNCTPCTARPTPQSSAYLGTWMDSTFNPDGTGTNDTPGQIIQAGVSFTGTIFQAISRE